MKHGEIPLVLMPKLRRIVFSALRRRGDLTELGKACGFRTGSERQGAYRAFRRREGRLTARTALSALRWAQERSSGQAIYVPNWVELQGVVRHLTSKLDTLNELCCLLELPSKRVARYLGLVPEETMPEGEIGLRILAWVRAEREACRAHGDEMSEFIREAFVVEDDFCVQRSAYLRRKLVCSALM